MAGQSSDYRDVRAAVAAMIPRVEGAPCACVCRDGSVFACRRISRLRIDEFSLDGRCDWVDPPAARPEELTDGVCISTDLLVVGPEWWLDRYFGWYFVFDPDLVTRSLAGDHSWACQFLYAVAGPAG